MTDFICEVDELYRSACKGLDFYAEHEGKRYCVLHYPGEDKKDDFTRVTQSKLAQKDYDFYGTVFPEGTSGFQGFEFDATANFAEAAFVGKADFSRAVFNGEWTFFVRAHFSAEGTIFRDTVFGGKTTSFSEANFSSRDTYFSEAEFSSERTTFYQAEFGGQTTTFSGAEFSARQTGFIRAKFSSELTAFTGSQFSSELTDFRQAQFSGAETSFRGAAINREMDLTRVTFKESVYFWGSNENPVFGSEAWVQFNRLRVDKPELLTFNTVLLRPGWFINADVRKVTFTDVAWYGMPGGPEGKLEDEIAALKQRDVESPYTLLSQACRRLSANAEDNREYPLANEFDYGRIA